MAHQNWHINVTFDFYKYIQVKLKSICSYTQINVIKKHFLI